MHCLIFNVNREGFMMGRTFGPYRIAHYLREHDWDAEVIDFFNFWTLEELKQLSMSRITQDTKFIGFGLFFVKHSDLLDLYCKWLKEIYPAVKLIVGSMAQWPYNSPHVDYNISGYGERALLELLKYLFSNGDPVKFSLFTNAGKHISGNDMYPAYPMKSLMVKYQDRDFLQPKEWLGIEFSRGCMFSCDFCNFPVLGVKGDYSRDADDFKEQIQDTYDRFGIQNYYTSDETFNDRTEKIAKFADVVQSLSFDTFFTGYVRPDLIVSRPRDREELLRMNYLGQWYGVESFNHSSAKSVGKGMHPDKMKQGLIDIRKYFETHGSKRYRGTISLIIGLPYETQHTLNDSKQWVIDNWQGQNIQPWPLEIFSSQFDEKSKMSVDYKKYGYRKIKDISDEDLSLFKTVNSSTDAFLWENDNMDIIDAQRINKEFKSIMNSNEYDFRLNAYHIANIGLPKDLDQRLACRVENTDEINNSKALVIKTYISKKLNYRHSI